MPQCSIKCHGFIYVIWTTINTKMRTKQKKNHQIYHISKLWQTQPLTLIWSICCCSCFCLLTPSWLICCLIHAVLKPIDYKPKRCSIVAVHSPSGCAKQCNEQRQRSCLHSHNNCSQSDATLHNGNSEANHNYQVCSCTRG